MDTISDLPDEIIIKILSFLSIDEAALTSILSKRWRDLFAFTPNLHLYRSNRTQCLSNFMDFVERVLAVSGNYAIRSFTLNCGDDVGSAHIDRWVRNVVKRGGVLDLHLGVFPQHDSLVFEVFACETLVTLTLDGFKIPRLPEDVSLQIGWEFRKLSHFLSCPTLKRLTTFSYYDDLLGNISFDYPKLVYLEYSSHLQLQYPLVNLDSLVEAKLKLSTRVGVSYPASYNPSNLLKGLRNVKILDLYSPTTVKIFEKFHEAVPVLSSSRVPCAAIMNPNMFAQASRKVLVYCHLL
ncbi:hypothetical protein AALP_AA8G147200 [Arabis alpina]|uniref:F-box domain-containing protein n=1 Tax=Arabis alpina TaxID=50452 RepID=A0A087G744_ARAAL|nr:hypothetical protein AALP_AA8G147200 [Arabis alpina]